MIIGVLIIVVLTLFLIYSYMNIKHIKIDKPVLDKVDSKSGFNPDCNSQDRVSLSIAKTLNLPQSDMTEADALHRGKHGVSKQPNHIKNMWKSCNDKSSNEFESILQKSME